MQFDSRETEHLRAAFHSHDLSRRRTKKLQHTPCASADIQQAPNYAAAEHRLHGGLNFRLRYMKRSNGVPFARMISEIMFGRLREVITHSREPSHIRFPPHPLTAGFFHTNTKTQ